MSIKKIQQWCVVILVCAGGFGLPGLVQAQINVTNLGAVGDLLALSSVQTVSNSTSVTCPGANFVSTDVNKLIEVFGAGAWEGQGNEDLFTRIVQVLSPTSIIVSTPAGATASSFTALYGTDCYPAFTKAVATCPAPTGTIIIPPGNYLLLPPAAFATNGYTGAVGYTIRLSRGGITFAGQGTAILTGMGGFVNYNSQASRSALFAMTMPMTNNYPLVFTNLTLDGGVAVGNIRNLSYPPSGSTGLGWDGTHHWMITIAGSGKIIDSLVMLSCNIRHWRGEMMEDTSTTANLFLTASNCFFYDGDASTINNFAHNVVDCTFSNANQVEEFYRTYTTNTSFLSGCTIVDMTGTTAIAVNGGYLNNPYYTINNCSFSNYNGAALLMLPGTCVNFFSNYVNCAYGVGPDDNGAQAGVGVSNIFEAFNTGGPNCQSLFYSFNGTSVFLPQQIFIYSNYWANANAIASGYGWTSNVFVFNNTGGGGGPNNGQTFGQYPFEQTNNNLAFAIVNSGNAARANLVSYSNGCFAKLTGVVSGSTFDLDNSSPWRIPPAAALILSNSTALSLPVYLTSPGTGTPISLSAGKSAMFGWNGSAWVYGGNIVVLGSPTMQVTPGTFSYGTILSGLSVTNNLTVQNIGGGTLSGVASVAAPFSILSGGAYTLGAGQSQLVSVVFNPAAAGSYSQSVTFTSTAGNPTNVVVTGVSTNVASGVLPTVSAINANVANQGSNPALLMINSGPVQLSATASANLSDALSWQWLYSTSGGIQTVFQRGSGTAPTVSFTDSANMGGTTTNVWTLQVTDTKNGLNAQSQISIYVVVPPVQGVLTIPH